MMTTNSDCTVYNRIRSNDGDTWKRIYVPAVWWYEEAKSSITTEGIKSGNVLTVRIPDISVKIKKDDIIIKGRINMEIDTVKDLVNAEYYKVTAVNYNRFGENQHIKVVGV
ncbi:MAG: DUF6751 family protein [Blautia sp.]